MPATDLLQRITVDPAICHGNRYGLPWQEMELPENPLAGIKA